MNSITQVAQEMQQVLSVEADQLGRESSFVQRQSKLGGAELAQTLAFGWLSNPQASLEELTQTAASLGVVITPQGLDQRFTSAAADCLKGVLEAAVKRVVCASSPAALPILQRFPAVYLQDSSIIKLPEELAKVWQGCGDRSGMGQAAVKIEVRWELLQGGLTGPYLEAGRVNEHRSQIQTVPLPTGALRLADLGYWSLSEMQTQTEAGVFWLSYLLMNTYILDQQQRRFQVLELLEAQGTSRIELPVSLGANLQVPARLLAVRVPQEVADRRSHRLRKRANQLQRPVNPTALALAEWTVVVTNVPPERLSLREAFILIRVRWQVELLFKLWKSQGQIDEWRSTKPWRIMCEVYAKLLALLIQHWLFLLGCWLSPDRSLVKAAQTVRRLALHLASDFARLDRLIEAIQTIQRCLSVGCCINKSRKTPRTYQQLLGFSQGGLA
jgi:hypothetical protein